MKCAHCGKDFEPVEKRGARKYCSRSCFDKARYRHNHPKLAKKKICPTCGKEFEAFYGQKKFCSAECKKRAKNHKPKTAEESQERICKYCGKPFTAKGVHQKYCSRLCCNRFWHGTPLNSVEKPPKKAKRKPTAQDFMKWLSAKRRVAS